jgi:hypothetical protein
MSAADQLAGLQHRKRVLGGQHGLRRSAACEGVGGEIADDVVARAPKDASAWRARIQRRTARAPPARLASAEGPCTTGRRWHR